MVWDHINPDKAHVAYAVLAVFATLFSLSSLFIKERLYIGEATVASIFGLIVGPHCLEWFVPNSWGNEKYITLEISRVLLCIEIVAVSVELPKKYIWKHWKGVLLLLLPVMTIGWLVIGLFIWAIFPGLTYGHGLLISACVTATDPVLAQAVVGKGKFAKRVPAHLRNLLSAESACNDGISVPFVYLSVEIILSNSNAGEIAAHWIPVTVLYECVFGAIFGAILGFSTRKAIRFAEEHDLIDRESFLAFYVMLALLCAGFGSILGIDDLLASFAAGAAFSWDGWFTHKTEETHVSTVIDLLLNLAYFVFFGAIIPWEQFNNKALGLDWWRLFCLALVVLFLRRIPAVLAIKPFSPDIKNWKEALFVGHFGPIGVGAVFAAILAVGEIEAHAVGIEHGPTYQYPNSDHYYQLIRVIWPIVCFLILTSIIVHGSSVAVLTLGRHLQTMTFTMTLTRVETEGGGWTSRLPRLERTSTSFSIKRIDTMAPSEMTSIGTNRFTPAGSGVTNGPVDLSRTTTIDDFGDKDYTVRPAGGMKNRRQKRRLHRQNKKQREGRKAPPVSETLDLGKNTAAMEETEISSSDKQTHIDVQNESSSMDASKNSADETTPVPAQFQMEPLVKINSHEGIKNLKDHYSVNSSDLQPQVDETGELRIPSYGYGDGSQLIIEDQYGEILHTVSSHDHSRRSLSPRQSSIDENKSVHSLGSLKKKVENIAHGKLSNEFHYNPELTKNRPEETMNTLVNKTDPHKKLYLGTGRKPSARPQDETRSKKYHGYRIDDNIIIEDEDGEIVGRYKVNQRKPTTNLSKTATAGSTASRTKSSIYLKAMGYMGLKKPESNHLSEKPDELPATSVDLERNQSDLVPDPSNDIEGKFTSRKKFERKMKGFLNANPKQVICSPVTDEDESENEDLNDEERGRAKYPEAKNASKAPSPSRPMFSLGSSPKPQKSGKRKQMGVQRELTGLPNEGPSLVDRKRAAEQPDSNSEEDEQAAAAGDSDESFDSEGDSSDEDGPAAAPAYK